MRKIVNLSFKLIDVMQPVREVQEEVDVFALV